MTYACQERPGNRIRLACLSWAKSEKTSGGLSGTEIIRKFLKKNITCIPIIYYIFSDKYILYYFFYIPIHTLVYLYI